MDRGAGGLRSTGSQSQARLHRLSTQAPTHLAPLQEPLSQEHRGRKRGLDFSKLEISFINTQAMEKLVYHTVRRSPEESMSLNI